MAVNAGNGQEQTRQACRRAMPYFERWLEADEVQRTGLVAGLAATDAAAHRYLLKLISADRAAESANFLDTEALSEVPSTPDEATLRDLVGARVGTWRMERLLGVGGCGQVWLAQRCDGSHAGQAAIKLLRVTAVDAHAQQRFAREGRLLARLDHPHIARLLDVGENLLGQRYLVLEYVDGERIDHWCDRHHASIESRLELFLQICDAVAYAHANLIVHRDLKPSNILVQADGDAKLLDFGIAKLLEGDGQFGEPTELTRAGGSAFTPEYAAPEQFSAQPATVTTDVYSLGMVLYLLLTGRRPYGEAHSTPAQLARAIHEIEPRRLSHAPGEKTQDSERIARARGVSHEQLRRTLRGDLDTIIARALKKDPNERYVSMQAFADDIRRYLDHKPIRARADSRVYRVRKFVRRHWVGVAASAAILLAALVAVFGVIRAERVATREAQRAQAVQQFLIGLFEQADPEHAQGENRTVRDLLERGEKDLRDKLNAQPQTKLALLSVLGNIHDELGDSRKAIDLAQTARDLAEREYGPVSLEFGDALQNLANAQKSANDATAAEKNYLQVRAIFNRYPGARAKELAMLPAYLAFIYGQAGRDEESLALLESALPEIERQVGAQSWELAERKSELAATYAKLNRQVEANKVYAALAPLLDAAPPEHALDVAVIRANYGYSLQVTGHTAECAVAIRKAVAEFDRLAGADNNYAVSALRTLGAAYVDAGEYTKAAATFDELIDRAARAFGAETPEFAINQSFRIGPMIMTGHAADAEFAMRQALQNARGKQGLTASEERGVQRRYALSLIWTGEAGRARDMLVDILASERESREPKGKIAASLLYLSGAQTASGDATHASASAHEAAEIYASIGKSTEQGIAQVNEAIATSAAGGASAALALLDQAQTNLRKKLDADHPKVLLAALVRAQVLRANERIADAVALERPTRAALKQRVGVELPDALVMLF